MEHVFCRFFALSYIDEKVLLEEAGAGRICSQPGPLRAGPQIQSIVDQSAFLAATLFPSELASTVIVKPLAWCNWYDFPAPL